VKAVETVIREIEEAIRERGFELPATSGVRA
jgi:hypothetical protein